MTVDYSDAKIHTRDYDLILHGQNDISRAVQLMLTNFKVFFEEELTSMLSSRLLKITEDFFYDRVLRSGDEHLNMSLLMNTLFYQHYISFVIDGTYDGQVDPSLSYEDVSKTKNLPGLPLLLSDPEAQGEKVQTEMFVSEQTLNSALQKLYTDGHLTMMRNVTSEFIASFIPRFEKVFSKHQNITLQIEAKQPPVFNISEKEDSVLSVSEVEIKVMNPYSLQGEGYEALTMGVSLVTDLDFELIVGEDQYTLGSNIQNTVITVNKLKTLFYSETTVDSLNEG